MKPGPGIESWVNHAWSRMNADEEPGMILMNPDRDDHAMRGTS